MTFKKPPMLFSKQAEEAKLQAKSGENDRAEIANTKLHFSSGQELLILLLELQ